VYASNEGDGLESATTQEILRGTPISEATFCAFDLETTGLSSLSRIVEVGAVRFKVGEEGEDLQTLVNPGCSIPPVVSRIHGITDDMVADAPPAREALERLIEFSHGCVMVAHNAAYDAGITGTELIRAGMEMPPRHVICTIKASKRLLPGMPRYRLQAVAEFLEIEVEGYHRALSDAHTAKAIFERAVSHAPGWKKRELDYYLGLCSWGMLGQNLDSERDTPPELEEVSRALSEAIDCMSEVIILYKSGDRRPWPAQVRPLDIIAVKGNHYLEASCANGDIKSYRLDRIKSVRLERAD
jgi:DNA polymerase III epsilon subunit family exonuclease